MTSVTSGLRPFYLDLGWKEIQGKKGCSSAACCEQVNDTQLSIAQVLTNKLMDKIVKEFEAVIHETTDPKIHVQNINKEIHEAGEVCEFSFNNQTDHIKRYVCWSVKKVRTIESKYVDPAIDEKLSKMDSKTLLGVKVMAAQILMRLPREYYTEMAILKTDDMKDIFEEGNPTVYKDKLGNHPFIKSLAMKFQMLAASQPIKK